MKKTIEIMFRTSHGTEGAWFPKYKISFLYFGPGFLFDNIIYLNTLRFMARKASNEMLPYIPTHASSAWTAKLIIKNMPFRYRIFMKYKIEMMMEEEPKKLQLQLELDFGG